MKIFVPIIVFLCFFSCSKKTHTLKQGETFSHLKKQFDSLKKKNLLSVDKSTITTNIDLDTSILVKGSSLSGYYSFTDTTRHFENADLSIDFKKDVSGAKVLFTALTKSKAVIAKYHRKTIAQNDIVKAKNAESNMRKTTDFQLDSTHKYVSDQREPTPGTSAVKSIIIWLTVLLVVAAACIIIIKKKFA